MSNEKRIERIESKIDEIYNEEVISLWKRIHKLENKNEALEKKVQELETKTASDLSQLVVAESATGEKDFDIQRALELVDIIDFEYWDCVTNKVMENSIEELRQMIGGSDE